jgi:hypothetical protein
VYGRFAGRLQPNLQQQAERATQVFVFPLEINAGSTALPTHRMIRAA